MSEKRRHYFLLTSTSHNQSSSATVSDSIMFGKPVFFVCNKQKRITGWSLWLRWTNLPASALCVYSRYDGGHSFISSCLYAPVGLLLKLWPAAVSGFFFVPEVFWRGVVCELDNEQWELTPLRQTSWSEVACLGSGGVWTRSRSASGFCRTATSK